MCIGILIADFLYSNMQTLKLGDISFRKRLAADQYPTFYDFFSRNILSEYTTFILCGTVYTEKSAFSSIFVKITRKLKWSARSIVCLCEYIKKYRETTQTRRKREVNKERDRNIVTRLSKTDRYTTSG